MACEVCEHCQAPINTNDFSIRDGYSYHRECQKCYVCSETNLANAEIFRGVIFCSSCSQRIFQGCSSARRTKTNQHYQQSNRPHQKHRNKTKQRDRRSCPPQDVNRVIELARLAAKQSGSGSSSGKFNKYPMESKVLVALTTEPELPVAKRNCENDRNKIIKMSSTEMGTTTVITQELLRQINPVAIEDIVKPSSLTKIRDNYKRNHRRTRTRRPICSDLRIAELGTSTEIANMALRKQSNEATIVLNSSNKSCPKPLNSSSFLTLNQESDISEDSQENVLDSKSNSILPRHIMNRHIGSIFKFPYTIFKNNVLRRSSLVSVLMCVSDNSVDNSRNELSSKLKTLLHNEIIEHQRRGLKRLYSALNRRRTPYKLGWLKLMINGSGGIRCKHYRRSHSYRCMREQIMRSAGPTKSELTVIRKKIRNALIPAFLKDFANYRRYPAIMMSEACSIDEKHLINK